MTEEKEWVRLGGKDGVYLVEGEDYTVDREKGILTINEEAWAKVHARCIKDMDVQVDVGREEHSANLAVDIGDYLRVCRSDPRTMMKMDNGMGINANE